MTEGGDVTSNQPAEPADPRSTPPGAVVVGVDGSESADLALTWAAEQAAHERRPLVLVHAVALPAPTAAPVLGWMDASGLDRVRLTSLLEEEGEALLGRCDERLLQTHPDLEIHHLVGLADPREALLQAAVDARLLVVGTRGLGPVRHLLLGSVSSAMVKHASCPVVVVRPEPHEPGPGHGGVLAGIAGEEGDAAVLALAFEVADTRGLPLTVFHCFWDAVKVAEGARDVAPGEPGLDDRWLILNEAVREPAAQHPGVSLHLQLTRGMVDERLIRASEDADLVVLGHRRKPFLSELVYGSVAPVVVERAACSVAVVPLGR